MNMIPLLLAMSFGVTACVDRVESPSDAFLISQEELQTVIDEADAGDLDAVKRLISHYEATTGNDAIAEEWSAKARSLGDAEELHYYAARLSIAARIETDPGKRREMLEEALKAAERSSSAHADRYNQALIEEITLSLKSM